MVFQHHATSSTPSWHPASLPSNLHSTLASYLVLGTAVVTTSVKSVNKTYGCSTEKPVHCSHYLYNYCLNRCSLYYCSHGQSQRKGYGHGRSTFCRSSFAHEEYRKFLLLCCRSDSTRLSELHVCDASVSVFLMRTVMSVLSCLDVGESLKSPHSGGRVWEENSPSNKVNKGLIVHRDVKIE